MAKKNIRIFVVLPVLMLLTLACSFSASTANIADAYMARDEAGDDRTDVFTPTDEFHSIVKLANAPDDTEVKATWYAVEVEGIDPNSQIAEFTLQTGDATIPFNLTNDNPWPAGSYKVDISLNGEVKKTLEFKVE